MIPPSKSSLHDTYSTFIHKDAIDEGYTALRARLEAAGLVCANDDRAEMLIAAIMRYVIESDPAQVTP